MLANNFDLNQTDTAINDANPKTKLFLHPKIKNPDLLFMEGRHDVPWPALLSSARKYLDPAEFGRAIDRAVRSCDRMKQIITLDNIEARMSLLENILQKAIQDSGRRTNENADAKANRLCHFVLENGENNYYVLENLMPPDVVSSLSARQQAHIRNAMQTTRQIVRSVCEDDAGLKNSSARLLHILEAILGFTSFVHESFKKAPSLLAAFSKALKVPPLLLLSRLEYLAESLGQSALIDDDGDELDGTFEYDTENLKSAYYDLESALADTLRNTYKNTTGMRISEHDNAVQTVDTQTVKARPRFVKLEAGSRIFRGAPVNNKKKLLLDKDATRPFWFADSLKVAILYASGNVNKEYKYEDVSNYSRLGYIGEYKVTSNCRLLDLTFPPSVAWLVRFAQSKGQTQIVEYIQQSFVDLGGVRIHRHSSRDLDYPLFNWFRMAVPSSIADGYIGAGWYGLHNELMLSRPWETISLEHIHDVH